MHKLSVAGRCLPMVLLVVAVCLATSARRASAAEIVTAEIGFQGNYKVGHWTPVRVVVDGGSEGFLGRLEVEALDSDGVRVLFHTADVQSLKVESGQTQSSWQYCKVGRVASPVRVVLRSSAGQVVATHNIQGRQPLLSTREWVIALGDDLGLPEAVESRQSALVENLSATIVSSIDRLPDRWIGYEGVNTIILPTATSTLVDGLSDQQFTALQQWVRLGGRLFLSVGTEAPRLFDGQHRFSAFAPGPFAELRRGWQSTGLEGLARATEPVPRDDGAGGPMATFASVHGRIICYEAGGGAADRPMLIRYPFGFGQVLFLAVDLNQPPLENWSGRLRLILNVLRGGLSERDDATANQGQLGQVAHVGFEDLAGQLRGALDKFANVTLVRFSWVAALIVLYLLLIGPLDYFWLRRIGRQHWTWVSFPLLVIGFCAVAVWLSQQFKGKQLLINQVDLVDVDTSTSTVRGTAWVHVYSPRTAALDFRMRLAAPSQSQFDVEGRLLSWQGLPGSGLGGMNTAATVTDVVSAYHIATDSVVSDQPPITHLPIQISSTKSMVARWWAEKKEGGQLIDTQLTTAQSGLLQGELVNPLDVTLNNAYVVSSNWMYRLPNRMLPGQRVLIEKIPPLDLRWQLTKRRLENTDDVAMPWDQADFDDLRRIVEMMLLHDAAGGSGYTRLSHRHQGYVDLSDHLMTGQAVLIGFHEQPVLEFSADGRDLSDRYDRQLTVYRVLFPVTSSDRAGESLVLESDRNQSP